MSLEEELANPSTEECLRIINNRLQQENARLREGLEKIVSLVEYDRPTYESMSCLLGTVSKTATEALQQNNNSELLESEEK